MEEKAVYHGATVVGEGANHPPPYGGPPPFGPQPLGPGPTIIQSPVIYSPPPISVPIVMTTPMGSKPARITCRSCHTEVTTRTEVRTSTRTHLFAGLLCILGCWPCVCIPYCVDSCKRIEHYCPQCNAFIGNNR